MTRDAMRAGTEWTLWTTRLVIVALGGACVLMSWAIALAGALDDLTPLACVVPGVSAYVAIYLWNVYFVGFRTAVVFSLAGDRLSWRAPFRAGSIALEDLARIESRGWPAARLIVHYRQGRVLANPMVRGLEPLVRAIAERRPELRVDTSRVEVYWKTATALGFPNRAR